MHKLLLLISKVDPCLEASSKCGVSHGADQGHKISMMTLDGGNADFEEREEEAPRETRVRLAEGRLQSKQPGH